MLRSLTIRDFVIVEHAVLEFGPGFTVLTGETGAGKSILIDALSLLSGARGDDAAVRAGAKQAEVAAEFDLSALPAATRWLVEAGLEGDPGDCLMRRLIDAGGRSRAFVNGHAVPIAQLRELGEMLVDIHGQHAHQSLLRSAAQRDLLDAYGGATALAKQVADAYRDWRGLRTRFEEATRDALRFEEERERISDRVAELSRLRFNLDEWQALNAEHARLAHATDLIAAATEAIDVLSEAEPSVARLVNGAVTRLMRAAEHDAQIKPIVDVLDSARIQAAEAVHALERYRSKLDADPRKLATLEQRIAAVHDTCRKYRVTPEAVPATLDAARARLGELEHDLDLARLESEVAGARRAYEALVQRLTQERKTAAGKLAREVSAALAHLAMAGGRFAVELEPAVDSDAHGAERVEFRIATHAGTAPGPLAKVASGGELSRVSLAIQTALSQVAEVPTLIFDEVDAGIGGRVAEIVGQMLNRLAARHQVMCITHLPQVAVCADRHWRVVKTETRAGAATGVAELREDERTAEIARMLGGLKITRTTLAHAAELLKGAVRR